jgi:hypothetical protein
MVHIFWKSDQDNNKDIQEHQYKTSIHSKRYTEKIAVTQEDDKQKQTGIHKLNPALVILTFLMPDSLTKEPAVAVMSIQIANEIVLCNPFLGTGLVNMFV